MFSSFLKRKKKIKRRRRILYNRKEEIWEPCVMSILSLFKRPSWSHTICCITVYNRFRMSFFFPPKRNLSIHIQFFLIFLSFFFFLLCLLLMSWMINFFIENANFLLKVKNGWIFWGHRYWYICWKGEHYHDFIRFYLLFKILSRINILTGICIWNNFFYF